VDATQKPPWDQRLAERLARESWEAANNQAGRVPNPPLKEQISSPYFKLALLAWLVALLAYILGGSAWVRLAALPLYFGGQFLARLAAREVRAASLLRNATKENT
jgi:hypothetical protein